MCHVAPGGTCFCGWGACTCLPDLPSIHPPCALSRLVPAVGHTRIQSPENSVPAHGIPGRMNKARQNGLQGWGTPPSKKPIWGQISWKEPPEPKEEVEGASACLILVILPMGSTGTGGVPTPNLDTHQDPPKKAQQPPSVVCDWEWRERGHWSPSGVEGIGEGLLFGVQACGGVLG